MAIYVSDLHIFDNGDEDVTFLGSIMASDKNLQELSDFMNDMGDMARTDSAKQYAPSAIDAYFIPSEYMPYYVITPKCRRVAVSKGARTLPMAMLVNKCSNGNYKEAWDDIYPFCV